MIYNIFPPTEELQTIVKQYVVISSLNGIDKLLFLPNGCNFIVFNRGIDAYSVIYNGDEKFFIPKNYSVSTKSKKVKQIVLSKQNNFSNQIFPLILVELTPIGFYKLFNIDASILSKAYLELENEIVERYFKDLYTHNNIEKELEYLNNTLNLLLSSQNNSHMPIEDVIDKIINSYHFEVTVEMLVKEFGYSQSTMERNFKKIIGLTPKNFIFIAKFCKTVLACIEERCTFNELQYLYSDNSHLNAVFKKFFGVNPSVILDEIANNKIKIYQMQRDKE
ncbi:MAG: helix-turn-helix transcriptional regulator [Sulfurimonas sp.]|nr:helix-turn-helix transcriptional regulator [Sulfurimonas sp.]